MGPKLVSCCGEEYGKMLKRIRVLQGGRVPDKEARNWMIEEYQRLYNDYENGKF